MDNSRTMPEVQMQTQAAHGRNNCAPRLCCPAWRDTIVTTTAKKIRMVLEAMDSTATSWHLLQS